MYVTDLGVKEVHFTGDGCTGKPMKDFFNDANGNNEYEKGEGEEEGEALGDTDITPPEWVEDGIDEDTLPDKQKRGLFVRNNAVTIKAVFRLEPECYFGQNLQVWATCNDGNFSLGSEEQPVTLAKEEGQWTGTFTAKENPASIGVYNITWCWNVKYGEDKTDSLGSSAHTLFVCKDQLPQGYVPYDWVAKWACEWAPAQPQQDSDILDEFIKRTNLQSTGMSYVYPNPNPKPGQLGYVFHPLSVEALLAYGKGSCSNWTYMWHYLAAVHNVPTYVRQAKIEGLTTPPWWFWAECFRTVELTAVNREPQT